MEKELISSVELAVESFHSVPVELFPTRSEPIAGIVVEPVSFSFENESFPSSREEKVVDMLEGLDSLLKRAEVLEDARTDVELDTAAAAAAIRYLKY